MWLHNAYVCVLTGQTIETAIEGKDEMGVEGNSQVFSRGNPWPDDTR